MRYLAVVLLLATTLAPLRAQNAELEEYRRLVNLLEDQQVAINALQRKLNQQEQEIRSLKSEVASLRSAASQNEEVKAVRDQVNRLAKKQEDDLQLILKTLKDISKVAATPPPAPRRTEPVGPPPSGEYVPYTVKSGDTVSSILLDYNKFLKEQGKDLKVSVKNVEEANPGLDPSKIVAGQTIYLPAPK